MISVPTRARAAPDLEPPGVLVGADGLLSPVPFAAPAGRP
jgi:hypothetical protein